MGRPTWAFAWIAALVGAAACSSGSSGSGPGSSSGSSSGSSGGGSDSGSGGGGTITVSCDYSTTTSHYCIELSNLSSTEASDQTSGCTMSKGTVGSGCAKTNLLGSCPAPTRTMYFYCGDVSSYETDCMLYKGTWMPGTGGQATCG